MKCARIIVACFALLLGPGFIFTLPATAQNTTFTYAGDWQGNGTLKTGSNVAHRRTRCQVTVIAENDPQGLRMDGVCAVAAGRSRFTLRAIWLDETRVTAGFRARGTPNTLQYLGASSNNQIELVSRETVLFNDQTYVSELIIDFTGDDAFTITEWLVAENDGVRQQTLSLDFKRKDRQN